ncbi:MAG: hypothetical protein WC346_19725 [Methanogenium sp.]|jgi:hypothetical protein
MAIIKLKEGYDVRPQGLYVLQVKKIDVRTAEKGPNAGNQFLAWEDLILESPDHPDLVGENYSHTTPPGCSPKSKYYPLFQTLGAGIPEGKKEFDLDTDLLIGKTFIAEIIITKVNDTERNEFKNIWSVEEFTNLQRRTDLLKQKLTGGTPSQTQVVTGSTMTSPVQTQVTPDVVQQQTVFTPPNSSILGGGSPSSILTTPATQNTNVNAPINTGDKRLSSFPT